MNLVRLYEVFEVVFSEAFSSLQCGRELKSLTTDNSGRPSLLLPFTVNKIQNIKYIFMLKNSKKFGLLQQPSPASPDFKN